MLNLFVLDVLSSVFSSGSLGLNDLLDIWSIFKNYRIEKVPDILTCFYLDNIEDIWVIV